MSEPGRWPLKLQAYVLVSVALALPALLWPLAWYVDIPVAPDAIYRNWLVAAATLLTAAVVADSVLSARGWPRALLTAPLWIIGTAAVVSLAFRLGGGLFLLACLFTLHAARSGIGLCRGSERWWFWPAWVRDTTAALGLFLWLLRAAPHG